MRLIVWLVLIPDEMWCMEFEDVILSWTLMFTAYIMSLRMNLYSYSDKNLKRFCTLLIKMIINFKTIKSNVAEHRFKFKKHYR